MADKDLQELAETMAHAARESLQRKGGVMPHALLVLPDGDGTRGEMIGLPFRDTREKWVMKQALRMKARQDGARALIFVSDMWVARTTADQRREDLPASLEDYAGRTEALCVYLCTPDAVQFWSFPYRREKGLIVWDEPLQPESYGAVHCDFNPWQPPRSAN